MNIHTPSDVVLVKSGLVVPITAAANTGKHVDTQGYTRAMVVFHSLPTGTGTTSDCKLQDGAAANGSDAADIAGAAFTQVTTVLGEKIQVMNVDLSKRKRYLTAIHTGAGGSAAGAASVEIVLFNGEAYPQAQDLTPVSI